MRSGNSRAVPGPSAFPVGNWELGMPNYDPSREGERADEGKSAGAVQPTAMGEAQAPNLPALCCFGQESVN